MEKRHVVKLGKREFNLAFTLKTMIRMQEDIPDFDLNNISDLLRKPKGILDVLYELAVSGEALEDRRLDVSKDWIGEHIPANRDKMLHVQQCIIDALTDGMRMETEEAENEDREVDVVLEEIKKKDEKTDSPGEK